MPAPSAFQRRQLARLRVRFHGWWASLHASDRLPWWRLATVAKVLAANERHTAALLRAEGWTPVQARFAGRPMPVWVPPAELGGKDPRRPRGRPRKTTYQP